MSSAENHQYTQEEADLKAAEVRTRARQTSDYKEAGKLIGELFAVQTFEQDGDPVHMNGAFMAMAKAYSPYQDHSETSRTEEQDGLREAQALMYMQGILEERMGNVLYELRYFSHTPWSTIASKLDEEPEQSKARMSMWEEPGTIRES